MKLAQLVDLEWQARRDESAVRAGDWQQLRERDRTVAARLLPELGLPAEGLRARLAAEPALRRQVATGWLRHVAALSGGGPGKRLARGHRLLGWLLWALALLLGAGAARMTLHYDGRQPVNVFYFLLVFAFLQILLLLVLLVAVLRAGRQGPADRGARGLLANLARSALVDRLLGARAGAPRELADLHEAESLRTVERWLLLATTQRFGVWFNLSALATCLYLVVFTDLAFGWSTTLQPEPVTVHRAMEWLALPWAWFAPQWVPTLEVVRESQWIRMQNGFAGALDLPQALTLAGQWWSFLVASLVCWGLLPRALALGFAHLRLRAALHGLPLDQACWQELFDRLVEPDTGWRNADPAQVGQLPAPATTRSGAAPLDGTLRAHLVGWGSLAPHGERLAELLRARFGSPPLAIHRAGTADLQDDQRAREALQAARPTQVVLLMAAGQQPTREVLGFLDGLRSALGPRTHLVLGLVDPRASGGFADADPDELQQWRAVLDRRADPYLRIVGMVQP